MNAEECAGGPLARIGLDAAQIRCFCDRWKIAAIEVFGSLLCADFRPDSDIDLLVTFAPGADWSLLDHLRMQEEFEEMTGRNVDLVSRRAVERSANWIRRRAILEHAEPLEPKEK